MKILRPNMQAPVADDLRHIHAQAATALARLAGGRVWITGGAGFLGYYLVQTLLHANDCGIDPIRVTVLDNFMRGTPAWLTELSSNPYLDLIKHDIAQPLPTGLATPNWIIHAASIASPIIYRQYPIETMDANILGLRQLLERALNEEINGMLFFSSSEIYGDPAPEWIPTPEHYNGNVSCTGPRACYDESKRFGETLCVNFARVYQLPVTLARPFNNYGPGLALNDRRVIPDFASNILAGRDIEMYSDGTPTRTFCYIADAVAGYLQVLTLGQPGEAYNIGSDSDEISIADLASKLIDIARDEIGYRGRLIRVTSGDVDYLTDNPNRRCPNIDKARKGLGFQPGIDLEQGLRRTLQWYRNQLREAA